MTKKLMTEKLMKEKTRVFRGNVEYAHTSVLIPKEVRDEARKMNIHMGEVLINGLMMKFDELDSKFSNEIHDEEGDKEP